MSVYKGELICFGPSLAECLSDFHFVCCDPSADWFPVSDRILGMEGLELEVLEFLATMADFVEGAVLGTRLSIPPSCLTVVPVRNDGVYLPALTSGPAQFKCKRALPLGLNAKTPDTKKIVLFPGSEQFKGVHCPISYVSLLQGQSKWKKTACDTKTADCGCSSMVSCTHIT